MKLFGQYESKKLPPEYLDFVADVKTVLNFGKYSAQVLTEAPTWKGREGEHAYRYVANGTAWDFYQYFWMNSGWVYMKWLGQATNAAYVWTPLEVSGDIVHMALSDRQVQSINIALGAIGSDNVAIDAIYTEALSARVVDTSKLGLGAVGSDNILANSILAGAISAGEITADAIAANAITVSHLSANAVTATAISSTAIIADKIAANAIISEKIASEAILASHLTAGELITLSAQIKDAIVTDAKIGSLDVNKLTAGTMAAINVVVATSGYILSQNYSANSDGFSLSGIKGLEINRGAIKWNALDDVIRSKLGSSNLGASWVEANFSTTTYTSVKTITLIKAGSLNTLSCQGRWDDAGANIECWAIIYVTSALSSAAAYELGPVDSTWNCSVNLGTVDVGSSYAIKLEAKRAGVGVGTIYDAIWSYDT